LPSLDRRLARLVVATDRQHRRPTLLDDGFRIGRVRLTRFPVARYWNLTSLNSFALRMLVRRVERPRLYERRAGVLEGFWAPPL
jgi:hypothetical protein